MAKHNVNGFAKMLLDSIDWSNAPACIVVEQGTTKTVYLKLGDTYTGVPVSKDGRVCYNAHSVVTEGEGAGFAFPPSATNFIGQENPGSRERVMSDRYHKVIETAVSSILAAAQSDARMDSNELLEFVNKEVGPRWLSFEAGEATHSDLAKAGAVGIDAVIVDFALSVGLVPKVDIKEALLERLPRGVFQVVSGRWGPQSDGYARSVRLPYALRDAAVKGGVQIKKKPRVQPKAAPKKTESQQPSAYSA